MKYEYNSQDELTVLTKTSRSLLIVILIGLVAEIGLLFLLLHRHSTQPFIDYPEEWQAAKVGDTLEVVKGNNDSLFIQFKFKHR